VRGLHLQHVLLDLLSPSFSRPLLRNPPFPRIPTAINEPGVQTECDGCLVDLTHSIRIKCADPACAVGDGVDLCPNCFCSGKEFGKHKRSHAYRVEVSNTRCNSYELRLTTLGLLKELHSYPIFTEDWGADE
jgi:transcriptional adapter 2-alpha